MSRARDFADLAGSADAGGLTGRNLLINGDYKIWQRATSSTAANYSGPDRWYYGNAGTYSRSTDVPSGQGFQYSNSVKVTAATTYGVTAQRIEAVNCKHLVGKSVTASFWLKTITGATGMYCILYRANAEDNFGGGVTVIEQKTFTGVTNTWTYYTLTWENLPSETTNGLQLYFFSADASTDPEYRITGVQLEVGSATPFEHRSFGDELARCKRYYEKTYPYATAPGTTAVYGSIWGISAVGFDEETSGQRQLVQTWKVEKRANPTITIYDNVGNSGKVTTTDSGGTQTNNRTVGLAFAGTSMYGAGPSNGAYAGLMFFCEGDAEL